ncbi:methyltransferase-domain-containing protein [Massariosphaeria phaeospora]|uniref:Ribosomal RNA-processing protein 8 n=1 Tax=Massariosphaeria phaeospora TaxID=100035 RepID=A0A7C8MD00_9PLEO|nr:methyltransferase-domain-containing protein [Massariosphaeria phaeospora]
MTPAPSPYWNLHELPPLPLSTAGSPSPIIPVTAQNPPLPPPFLLPSPILQTKLPVPPPLYPCFRIQLTLFYLDPDRTMPSNTTMLKRHFVTAQEADDAALDLAKSVRAEGEVVMLMSVLKVYVKASDEEVELKEYLVGTWERDEYAKISHHELEEEVQGYYARKAKSKRLRPNKTPSTSTMFLVPGWKLSAPLKAQVEKPKPLDPTKESKKSKKRKRKQEEQVDEGNVGESWQKYVEGKDQKDEVQGTVIEPDGVGNKVASVEEEKVKKRKRKGNKPKQEGIGNEMKSEVQNADADTDAGAQPSTVETGAITNAESKRDKKKRKKEPKQDSDTTATAPIIARLDPSVSLLPEPKGLTPLQRSMRSKLASARFRHMNESLYTKPSKESLDLFKEDPSMFEDYHRGFAQQVEVWPENPVDGYVSTIITRGRIRAKDPRKDKRLKAQKDKDSSTVITADSISGAGTPDLKPLPRDLKGHTTIADLGCGTASLSFRLQTHLKSLNLTLHSFDLSKPTGPSAPLVTVADISALPVPHNSVDVAIFCLALMGTNWLDFIDEAYRVLRWRGELWISEIKSRFGRVERGKGGKPPINSIGSLKKADKKPNGKEARSKPEDDGIQGSGDEAELAERVDGAASKEGTDVSAFVEVLRKRGFVLDALPERPRDAIDLSNKMFVKLQFIKGAQPLKGKNVKKDDGSKTAKSGLKMGMRGKKYAALGAGDLEDGGEGEDGKVLKPCLYKIR